MFARFLFFFSLLLMLSLNFGLATEVIKDPLHVQSSHEKIVIHDMSTLDLQFDLALPEKYHAYSDSFKVEVTNPKNSLAVQSVSISPEVEFYDKFTKRNRKSIQEKGEMLVKLIVKNLNFQDLKEIQMILTYQACSDQFCLLPTHKAITQAIELQAENAAKPTVTSTLGGISISDLIGKKSWLAFFLIFFAGILTSFTPCIFPMIPITLSILGSQTIGKSRWRGFLISLVYVHGIATTYSILGLLAAKTGTLFGSVMNNPIAILILSLIFITMALSLFDFYEIQMPALVRHRLGNARTSQTYIGAYLSGMIAGIVASPCVGPVLVALLAYVAESQNQIFGFFLLFTYAMGMGMIFIVLGTSSHLLNRLPRSGPWMVRVKKAFGTILILMAFYYAYPVAKNYFSMGMSTVSKYQDWQPFSENALQKNIGKNVIIIDFFADWCAACTELDKFTYSNLEVKAKMSHATLFKVDATQENESVTPILQKYGIIGLPTVIFIEKDGTVRTDLTLTGYEPAADFLNRLAKLNSL